MWFQGWVCSSEGGCSLNPRAKQNKDDSSNNNKVRTNKHENDSSEWRSRSLQALVLMLLVLMLLGWSSWQHKLSLHKAVVSILSNSNKSDDDKNTNNILEGAYTIHTVLFYSTLCSLITLKAIYVATW